MPSQENLHSIAAVSELIRTGQMSPIRLVEECLERIDALQPSINAFITVLADEARHKAKQAESEIKAGNWRGPLHGIPVGIKDMYDTAGIPTTAAFVHFKDRVPLKDAVAVRLLKEAGAIVIGKTNMHELAMGTTSLTSYFGPVLNPVNQSYIAGGSSGGSAAAVASGICYATIDTDAIGSCRLPASCCGVVGYKCTWGMIDNSGILDGEQADEMILKLACVGITTRYAGDTSLILDVLADTSKFPQPDISKLRIGVVDNFTASPGISAVFEKAVETFGGLGCDVSNASAPFAVQPDMNIDESRKAANADIFDRANVDVLVLPTTAAEVPTVQSAANDPQALSPQNTFFANYYALPAISVPCGFDQNGLPVGLQIVGRTGEDNTVIRVAQAFQEAAAKGFSMKQGGI